MSLPPEAHVFTTLLFVRFREHVKQLLDRSDTIPSYTPHGLSHIQGVEAAVEYLASFLDSDHPLTQLERVLLRFCAWSHDLGMIMEVAEVYQKDVHGRGPGTYDSELLRKQHDQASAYFVQRTVPDLFEEIQNALKIDTTMGLEIARDALVFRAEAELPQATVTETVEFFKNRDNKQRWSAHAATLANTVNLISRYHRRAETIDAAPHMRHYLNQPIRLQLLAAVFRLADALHVDRTRFEQTGYDMLARSPQFTDESRVHWIKSFIVSSIRVDRNAHTVHVQADVPVTWQMGGADFGLDSERMRGMVTYIVNDLADDVTSVSRILLEAGFPPLLGVTSEIHEIPAMHYPEDVRSALNHIYASSSPNTSRLITIALDVLGWYLREAEKRADGVTYLLEKLDEQRNSLAEQLEYRPCHEALRKVHDLLGAVQNAWNRSDFPKDALTHICGERRTLYTLLDGVRETFRFKREEVLAGSDAPEFLTIFDGRTDIVLYGYSEQVLALLSRLNGARPVSAPNVHVLECRTKTSYAPAGDLLYLDGERYARALVASGYKGVVTIEPDAAVGRILTASRRPLVLLGSNAVYPGGMFVHSMGHLTVAAAAKSPHLKENCRVVVVTDSMKIGVHHDSSRREERNHEKWLTPRKDVIARLKAAGIELHNWQEDTVPSDLIDNLLVLDAKGKDKETDKDKKILSHPYDEVDNLRFAASGVYCDNLENRLLASYIWFAQSSLPQFVKDELAKRSATTEGMDPNVGNWNVAVAYTAKDETLPQPVRDWLGGAWTNRAGSLITTAKNIVAEEYEKLLRRHRLSPMERPAPPPHKGPPPQHPTPLKDRPRV